MVGKRDRSELLCPGGSWDPALDGEEPNDESLIRTAIRTMKELSGLDLSGCTQWYKFMEVHYFRPETSEANSHTEINAIFIPDAWNIIPSVEEFTALYNKRRVESAARKEEKKKSQLNAESTSEIKMETTESTVQQSEVPQLKEEEKKGPDESQVKLQEENAISEVKGELKEVKIESKEEKKN